VQPEGENRWRVDGAADLHYLEQVLETRALVTEGADYTSIAGLLLDRFASFPEPGTALDLDGWRYQVAEVDGRRITTILISRVGEIPDPEAQN